MANSARSSVAWNRSLIHEGGFFVMFRLRRGCSVAARGLKEKCKNNTLFCSKICVIEKNVLLLHPQRRKKENN